MYGTVRLLVLATIASCSLTTSLTAQPQHISYQGELITNGSPWSGDASFKFVIVEGNTSLWSNDGTSASGSEPSGFVTIQGIEGGVFSVLLGAPPMVLLPPQTVANASAPLLRIWVDTGSGFEQLSDQPISSVAFSHRAALADSAAVGAGSGGDSPWTVDGSDIHRVEGLVGVGTADPIMKLHVFSDDDGPLILDVPPGESPRLFTGTGTEELNRYLELINSPSLRSASGLKAGGVLVADDYEYALPDKNGLVVKGKVGIGEPAPAYPLDVAGTIAGHHLRSSSEDPDQGGGQLRIEVTNPTNSSHRIMVAAKRFGADNGVAEWASELVSGSEPNLRFWRVGRYDSGNSWGDLNQLLLHWNGNVGIGVAEPTSKLDVNGTTRTHILEITGGADIAEPFDLVAPRGAESGMVVVIDSVEPGRLRISERAYDRRVAGVISGAGGVAAGITLQHEGSPASGSHPVALAGRVYCRCDASSGAIEAGDLLTTSDTPGHAMKVSDHARAQGAILGKAMSRLDDGRGLVLVLVTLQ